MVRDYCIVGLGSRGLRMFAKDLLANYRDVARLTGICDINPGRLSYAGKELGADIPPFVDFAGMLGAVSCDTVIVATKDAAHHEYIIAALEAGKDVITEKPMTIDGPKCRAILDAEERTGRRVTVTFNYRYAPYKTAVKQLLRDGVVGDIHSVEFRWFLDTVHGADYFRRWHRHKQDSGGLFVHKASHHFDLVNWWLDLEPQDVFAMGGRHFYTADRMTGRGERCSDCMARSDCPFYFDISHGRMKALYADNEHHDGYHRDQCVFSGSTDIEDTMSALVRYERGVQLTYALTAYAPFEGWKVAFNGSKGRLEAFEPEYFVSVENQTAFQQRQSPELRRPVDWTSGDALAGRDVESLQIKFYPVFGGAQTWAVPVQTGGHGGGDRLLKDHLFRPDAPDRYGHRAGSRAGALAVLVGAAANVSMDEGRLVHISEFMP